MPRLTGLILKDWRGNDYTVGSTIVYATSQSSHVSMNEGIVDEIIEKPETDHRGRFKLRVTPIHGGTSKQVTLTSLNRVITVEPRS